jgi:hypothetical protein
MVGARRCDSASAEHGGVVDFVIRFLPAPVAGRVGISVELNSTLVFPSVTDSVRLLRGKR